MTETVPFAEQVSAVTPLDGDAIDGTPRPKTRRPRKPAREPMDRSHTFFCSNPQCDHATWAPADQARHMAQEFWEVAKALVELAPDSPQAFKLTGGVILKDLTDDELRAAKTEESRIRRERGGTWSRDDMPIQLRLRVNEYSRRWKWGELSEPVAPVRRQPPKTHCKRGHPLSGDNLINKSDGSRWCRECKRQWQRDRMADPEHRARVNEQARIRAQSPEAKAKAKEKAKRDWQETKEDPEAYALRLQRAREYRQNNPEFRKRDNERRKRASQQAKAEREP